MSGDACGDVHLYKFSNPIMIIIASTPGFHQPRAAEKMWGMHLFSSTHTNAGIIYVNNNDASIIAMNQ